MSDQASNPKTNDPKNSQTTRQKNPSQQFDFLKKYRCDSNGISSSEDITNKLINLGYNQLPLKVLDQGYLASMLLEEFHRNCHKDSIYDQSSHFDFTKTRFI